MRCDSESVPPRDGDQKIRSRIASSSAALLGGLPAGRAGRIAVTTSGVQPEGSVRIVTSSTSSVGASLCPLDRDIVRVRAPAELRLELADPGPLSSEGFGEGLGLEVDLRLLCRAAENDSPEHDPREEDRAD